MIHRTKPTQKIDGVRLRQSGIMLDRKGNIHTVDKLGDNTIQRIEERYLKKITKKIILNVGIFIIAYTIGELIISHYFLK